MVRIKVKERNHDGTSQKRVLWSLLWEIQANIFRISQTNDAIYMITNERMMDVILNENNRSFMIRVLKFKNPLDIVLLFYNTYSIYLYEYKLQKLPTSQLSFGMLLNNILTSDINQFITVDRQNTENTLQINMLFPNVWARKQQISVLCPCYE